MPDQPKDSISQRSQSINWLVGLSGAALGGALLKFDWLLKLRLGAKLAFLFAAILFLMSILFGVYYVFQTLAVGSLQEDLNKTKAVWPPDDQSTNKASKIGRAHV